MANNGASDRNLMPLVQSGGEMAQSNVEPGMGIHLSNGRIVDLSGLTEAQRQALQIKSAEGLIDVSKNAYVLASDFGALNNVLATLSRNTNDVAAAGQSVTITHTQDTSLGRTEIIMGTSEAAKQGKFTRTQTGDIDHTNLYAAIALVAVAIVAVVLIVNGR